MSRRKFCLSIRTLGLPAVASPSWPYGRGPAGPKKYYIHDIGGSKYFPDDFKKCLMEMKKIEKEVGEIFINAEKYSGRHNHQYDKSG